ncbi:uncharacterized protein LOC111086671 [Limulus polyphemus]|uniref:Uncharacterized protein LOC111086671 n=1 Tax=Limulus polyphemus TaxID=6850 RepID=A0ABM1SRB2_LIMPO|nr:uncharacterized protein LOC111086671 [Limulus polyphemus]
MLKKCGIFISFLGILFCPRHKARQLLVTEELTSDNLRNVHAFTEFGERDRVQKLLFTATPMLYRTDKADDHSAHKQNIAVSQLPSREMITSSPEVTVALPDLGNDEKVNTNVLNSSENEETYYLNSSYVREYNSFKHKIVSELEEKSLIAGTHPFLKNIIQNSSHIRIVGDMNPSLTRERYCEEIEEKGVLWNTTEGGVVVLTSCPDGYIGSVYRSCYTSGRWGHIHFFDCRFRKLLELKTLLDYHLVKKLWDGLHYVMEELTSMLGSHKIYSLMDRLEAMCMVSDVMRAETDLILNNCLDVTYIKVVLSNVEKLLTYEGTALSTNSDTHALLKEKVIDLVQSLAKFAGEILKAYVSSFGRHIIISPTSVIELIVASRDDNPSGLENSSLLEEKISVPRLQELEEEDWTLLRLCAERVEVTN